MQSIKGNLYKLVSVATPVLLGASTASAGMFGDTTGIGSQQTADKAVLGLISTVLGFLGVLAVIYGIYGGFLMMNDQGKGEGMKKGKTIITNVIIGLIVMFLANAIIKFVVTSILGAQQ